MNDRARKPVAYRVESDRLLLRCWSPSATELRDGDGSETRRASGRGAPLKVLQEKMKALALENPAMLKAWAERYQVNKAFQERRKEQFD